MCNLGTGNKYDIQYCDYLPLSLLGLIVHYYRIAGYYFV